MSLVSRGHATTFQRTRTDTFGLYSANSWYASVHHDFIIKKDSLKLKLKMSFIIKRFIQLSTRSRIESKRAIHDASAIRHVIIMQSLMRKLVTLVLVVLSANVAIMDLPCKD